MKKTMKAFLLLAMTVAVSFSALTATAGSIKAEEFSEYTVEGVMDILMAEPEEARITPCCDANYQLEWVPYLSFHGYADLGNGTKMCTVHDIIERQVCRKCGAEWNNYRNITEPGCGLIVPA